MRNILLINYLNEYVISLRFFSVHQFCNVLLLSKKYIKNCNIVFLLKVHMQIRTKYNINVDASSSYIYITPVIVHILLCFIRRRELKTFLRKVLLKQS